MTEINLTSNDVILGVEKQWHPLPIYRAAGVPVALFTDDEGVSRINITHEYTRAVLDFGLSYLDLKKMARTSLEHSFLPGPSLLAAGGLLHRSQPGLLCMAARREPTQLRSASPSCNPVKRPLNNGNSNTATCSLNLTNDRLAILVAPHPERSEESQ